MIIPAHKALGVGNDIYGVAGSNSPNGSNRSSIMPDAPNGIIYVHEMLGHVCVPKDAIKPTGVITCDGHMFNSPHNIVGFLEAQYGYIGTDAVFNSTTMKYDKS